MGFHIWQTKTMSIRDVLAENFKKLRLANPALSTLPQLVDAGAPSKGTLDRVTRSEVDLGIDKLEPLAAVYGIEPWQLIHPKFEPGSLTDVKVAQSSARYSHVAQSIAFLVDQVPDSDIETKRQMLLAVSRISQEWSERKESTPPLALRQKRPAKSPQVKT